RLPARTVATSPGSSGRHQRSSRMLAAAIVLPTTSGSSWRRIVSTSGSSGTPRLSRPGVRAEVRVLDPVAGEVRIELGSRDVGVAQHLLDRAQVAAAGQEMRGEAVAQRVGAHLLVQANLLGVTLDDLVEALARQRAAAEVDEQLGLRTGADQLGT